MAKRKPKPLTPAQQAAKIAQQILGPQIQSTRQGYRDQGASAQAAYEAAARMSEPVGQEVENTYAAASARDAVIAKGFAVGQQLAENSAAGESNAFLAQQGSPQQVKAAGAGDILGMLGGLTASGLNREGAAFSSAARFLPTQSRNLGIDAVTQAGREGATAIAGINAKRPELVQGILGQIEDQRTKDRAAQLNELIAVENLGVKRAQLGISQQNANTSSASVKLRAANQRFTQSLAAAKLDLSGEQLDLAWKRESRLSKPKAKGGFTAKQKQDLAATATASARDAFAGYTDRDTGEKVPPRKPVEVLRDLIAAGVPFSLAIRAIQRFGKDPSADQFWRATLKWTKK